MRTIQTSWKLIEEVLWEHAHSVYKALRKPTTDVKLAHLEDMLQAQLPPDFKQSLLLHDGMRETGQPCLLNGMNLLSTRAIADTWKMRCSVHGNDAPGGCPVTTDIRIKNDRWWRPGWVPFMEENGNMLLIDLDPGPGGAVGQVFKFYNSPSRPRRVVANGFRTWMDSIAEALVKRKFRFSEQGDIWMEDLELA